MGGPGPRATPTLANGALYVVGSTGAFLRLNPVTGEIVWKKELTQVADSKVPMWGFYRPWCSDLLSLFMEAALGRKDCSRSRQLLATSAGPFLAP